MLFLSNYWFVSKDKRIEMLKNFIRSDEDNTNLIIITFKDYSEEILRNCVSSITDENIKCNIKIISNHETVFHEESATHTKTIHIRNSLDTETLDLINTLIPVLALFI